METGLKDAVAMLYGRKASLMLALKEAVANALDAGADTVTIRLEGSLTSESGRTRGGKGTRKSRADSLAVTVTDNGHGFREEDTKRFLSLFHKADARHKGMGRLSYTAVFRDVTLISTDKAGTCTEIVFTDPPEVRHPDAVGEPVCGTRLIMKHPLREIKRSEIEPGTIREELFKEFFASLFLHKEKGGFREIRITSSFITGNDGGLTDESITDKTETITADDLIALREYDLRVGTAFCKSYYAFVPPGRDFGGNFIGLDVDGRTRGLAREFTQSFRGRYAVFIIVSDDAGVIEAEEDPARTGVHIEAQSRARLLESVKKALYQLACSEVEGFREHAEAQRRGIVQRLPFLDRYIDSDLIGLMSGDAIIERAYNSQIKDRTAFFGGESCTSKSDFHKRFEFASVVLAEYIVSRERILEMMRAFTKEDREKTIHDLLMPMRTEDSAGSDMLTNLWVLDERFMSYTYVYSDRTINRLIARIEGRTREQIDHPSSGNRPDLAIVFSADPDDDEVQAVDVVIVELKRRGFGRDYVEDLQREACNSAYKLYDECLKIRRIWFYGIADFTECGYDLRHLRTEKFVPMFSSGHCYYKSLELYDKETGSVPAGVMDFFLMDYEAVITDAETRLSTFRKVFLKAFRSSEA